MTALRAAIVDDEPMARARLARLLGDEDGVEIVGEYADGAAALEGLRQGGADVVFLDIRMPGIDGFGLLDALPRARQPLVVFVTAYSEHALNAFDVHAVDYLVKPLSPQRLHEAVERARVWMASREDAAAVRVPATQQGGGLQRLAVPDGARMRMVAVADIACLLAQGNYVEIVLAERSLLLRETLTSLLDRLDPAAFVRIHRSRAVRIDMIEQIEPYGAGQYWLRLKGGQCMTSGRSYRRQLREALGLSP